MSRSRRSNPIHGWTTAVSEKQDKQLWHRRFRTAIRCNVRIGREDLPSFRQFSSEWMSKDGKMRFDPAEHPQLMRK